MFLFIVFFRLSRGDVKLMQISEVPLENLGNNVIKRLSNPVKAIRNKCWMKKGKDEQYLFTTAAGGFLHSFHRRPIVS